MIYEETQATSIMLANLVTVETLVCEWRLNQYMDLMKK
jgi:hypothetical protein